MKAQRKYPGDERKAREIQEYIMAITGTQQSRTALVDSQKMDGQR